MQGRTVFSRSCALHTIARNACKIVYTKLKHNIHYIKEYVGKQKDRKIAFSTLN